MVAVEPFSWVATLAAVLHWIAAKGCGWRPLEVRIDVEEDSVVVSYRLPSGADVDPGELAELRVASPGEEPVPLEEAIRNNRAEIWTKKLDDGFEVRLAMTKAAGLPEYEKPPEIVDDQPEFYSFDLFAARRSGGASEVQLETALRDLEYVVFDTETTGLDISTGDRIVSISGVRVRGTKVLRADTFHSLVNPGRPVPPASTAIHGITEEMVAGAPDIGQIIPQFEQWVGNAVLVAHNAAFDKKVLDVSADERGLPKLENQILDTLFLSYGTHPDIEGHNLEALANRMGVEIEGRHTSLGDARTTAHIFVQLIPLLEGRGIHTLAEAKAFCDKMVLFRWQTSRF
jgi:DNA polymerase-3 subunit epsilon